MKYLFILLIGLLLWACSPKYPLQMSSTLSPSCHIEGTGKYTFVMDAGMGNWSIFYQPLFQKLKTKTRVCLLNRPGYAHSNATNSPRDAKQIAKDIHHLLQEKGIHQNIILVGHSLGGLHVRMYQALYPNEVVGMVLLDAAHPQQFKRLPAAFEEQLREQVQSLDKVIKFAEKGWIEKSKKRIPTFSLPDSLLPTYYQFTTQPVYYHTMKTEVLAFEKSLAQVDSLPSLGHLPLLVIGAKNSMHASILPHKKKDFPFEQHNQKWLALQKDLALISSQSTFIISEKDHYLLVSDTELVLQSIFNFYANYYE